MRPGDEGGRGGRGRVIDKLEIRIPARVRSRPVAYSPEVERICRETRGTRENPFRASLHYLAGADLRPFGISAILHTTCRHGDGDHKLELLDTGQMSYAAMLGEVERVYRVDTRGLDVMRIDLCADVEGVRCRGSTSTYG